MIVKPTVFILGAGASMPYHFPSGAKLKKEVLLRLRSDIEPNFVETLKDLGHSESEILEFRHCLYYSGRNSVDEFLEYRKEFIPIGKLTIALSLIPCEKIETLFGVEGEWYQYIFNKLSAPFEDFGKNKLSIITYNYDRSLEYYLLESLKNSYGKSDMECADKLKLISFIHVHGKLGSLPWEKGIKRPYEPNYEKKSIRSISEKITIVSEDPKEYDVFDDCYEILAAAEFIYFFGFGYHDENLKRINIGDFAKRTPTGTAVGLGEAEKNNILHKWKIRPLDYSTMDFLKEQVTWVNIHR